MCASTSHESTSACRQDYVIMFLAEPQGLILANCTVLTALYITEVATPMFD